MSDGRAIRGEYFLLIFPVCLQTYFYGISSQFFLKIEEYYKVDRFKFENILRTIFVGLIKERDVTVGLV
jgi:hypothetical protein